jgi:hypothetical protein
MRIALLVNTTLHWLAGNPAANQREHSWASDWSLTPQAEVQIARFVRANFGKPIDRGGLLNIVSFSTSRTFATPQAAELYALDLDTAARAGILIMEAVGSGGGYRQMANTVINPPARRLAGCTLFLDYTAQGGAITAWTPPPPP